MFKNMKTRTLSHAAVIFFLAIFLTGLIHAQTPRKSRTPEFQRFSLSLGGGMASLEEHRHLLNLGAEVQVALASRVRLGVGVGYLNNLHGRRGGMDGGYSNEQDGRMSGWMGMNQNRNGAYGWNEQAGGSGAAIRVIPVTLNIYYLVPAGRRWNVYAAAGASYNFGSFREGTLSQRKRAWGGQAGLGVEFRLADRLRLMAEGGYRFVEFRKLKHPDPPLNPWLELLGLCPDSRSRTGLGKLIGELLDQAFGLPQRTEDRYYDLNMNGFNCRLGVKFGF